MPDILNNASKKFWEALDGFANSTAGTNKVQVKPEKKQLTPKQSIDPLWYAEWNDDYLSVVLNNAVTRKCLKAIADKYYGSQVDDIVKHSTELAENTHPSIYCIYKLCVTSLKIKDPPKVFITNKLKGINALSIETQGKQIILLGRKTTMLLSEAELTFLLGHELGHHQQGNLVCHTVNGLMNNLVRSSKIFGPIILDTIEVPLKRWCKQSEYNADRAGYLCCKNINVVKSLFLKLGMIETPSSFHHYIETGEDHPMFITRYNQLLQYIKSKQI